MGWACGVYGWGEGVYRVLVGKPEGRRPLGRPRRRWADNITMDLQEVGCGYMDCFGLAQDRARWQTLVNAVMNLRVPWNAGNLLTSCKPVSFSRRTLHHGVSKLVKEYTNSLYCTFVKQTNLNVLWKTNVKRRIIPEVTVRYVTIQSDYGAKFCSKDAAVHSTINCDDLIIYRLIDRSGLLW